MKILLDTCAFLWLTTNDPCLSQKAKQAFQNTENSIYLSSVSVWEMLVKHQLGKLPLPTDAEQHFIEYLPLSESAVFQLNKLPNFHRDPFDKMLVCQALSENLTILTSDSMITQYPAATLW